MYNDSPRNYCGDGSVCFQTHAKVEVRGGAKDFHMMCTEKIVSVSQETMCATTGDVPSLAHILCHDPR